jgi:hypothetical protein
MIRFLNVFLMALSCGGPCEPFCAVKFYTLDDSVMFHLTRVADADSVGNTGLPPQQQQVPLATWRTQQHHASMPTFTAAQQELLHQSLLGPAEVVRSVTSKSASSSSTSTVSDEAGEISPGSNRHVQFTF